MHAVAFFRNLNLGQGVSPTRAVLLDAFAGAGAQGALSFQVNGTVAYAATDDEHALRIGREVVGRLTSLSGYADTVVVRPVVWLRALDLAGRHDPDGTEVAFFDGPEPFPEPLPWDGPRGDLRVLAADDRHAIALNADPRRSQATPVLERRLGVPVTSRGVGTVLRLLARLDRPDRPDRPVPG